MRLNNHIALRFLTDDRLAFEVIEETHGLKVKDRHDLLFRVGGMLEKPKDEYKGDAAKIFQLWELVSKDDQKAYMVTDTVHDKLDMLKLKRDANDHYDWTVFKNIPECKKTFILMPDKKWDGGGVIRLLNDGQALQFCHLAFKFNDKKVDDNAGQALWTLFYINQFNNDHAEHCQHQNVKDIYEFVYKLMCFIFLSENEYEVIEPGRKSGTKKKGKIINDLPVPITVINSKWNITVIRTDDFAVSGHFALRRCGIAFSDTRMVYIEPYLKHGYIRKAKNLTENE